MRMMICLIFSSKNRKAFFISPFSAFSIKFCCRMSIFSCILAFYFSYKSLYSFLSKSWSSSCVFFLNWFRRISTNWSSLFFSSCFFTSSFSSSILLTSFSIFLPFILFFSSKTKNLFRNSSSSYFEDRACFSRVSMQCLNSAPSFSSGSSSTATFFFVSFLLA